MTEGLVKLLAFNMHVIHFMEFFGSDLGKLEYGKHLVSTATELKVRPYETFTKPLRKPLRNLS